MLTIRQEQMDVLSAHMRQQFEQRMIKHLRAKFPDRTKDLPDERIRLVVQDSTRRS